MAYTVITTYFRRTSRTNISVFVANQILFFIYKTYFDPVISKKVFTGEKKLKNSITKLTKKDFSRENIFQSLTKTKKDKLEKFIEIPFLSKENLNNGNPSDSDTKILNKAKNLKKELIFTHILSFTNKIIIRKKLEHLKFKEYLEKNKNLIEFNNLIENFELDLSIDYNDFIREVCINQEANNKNKESLYFLNKIINIEDNLLLACQDKTELNKKLELDLIITTFKIKLGERFISYFEDFGLINETWRDGTRHIILQDMDAESSQNLKSLDFNERMLQENIDNLTNILPTNLPMICQPNKWSNTEYGGYLNNSIEKNNLISGLGFGNAHKVKSLELLYKSINYLNSIEFRVNNELLNYILENKKILFNNYYSNLDLEKSKDSALRDFVTLEIAKTFSNIPFYLNTFADWRGRIYTQSYYLSYQGSDISLALLEFNEGQIINEKGLYFLKIYGANVHNENKISRASYSDRIRWVDQNESKILNVDIDFILKADSRFAFISFCLAYKRFKAGKKVHLPIWLDATCSGIQHFATMIKDEELAISVNVITNPENKDKVQDIYSEMIEPTHKKLKEISNDNPKFYKLGMVKLNRKLIKPSIMTRTYNVTVKGVANQLISSFEKYTKKGISKINDPKILNNFYFYKY